MRRRSGFTLIEMMIVLAIIAALAATLVPIAMNALNQSKVTGNLTDLESIRLAAMQYFYKEGSFTKGTGTNDTYMDLLNYYLSWSNLQGDNITEINSGDKGYDLSTTVDGGSVLTVEMTFANEQLANAFMAQWTNINGQQTANKVGTKITVTYTFQ